jgi:hypothetical protein
MGKRYLIDTNTIIDFLGNKLSSTVIDWLEQIIDNQEHCLSVINKIELLSFNGDPAEMAITKAFIADATLLPITDSIIDTTIDIRKTKKVKLPDALIAATVKIHNLTIITRNISDFKDFIGIDSIINPYDI